MKTLASCMLCRLHAVVSRDRMTDDSEDVSSFYRRCPQLNSVLNRTICSTVLRLFACEIRKLAYLACERVSCVAVGAKWMSKVTRSESASEARPCSCHQL